MVLILYAILLFMTVGIYIWRGRPTALRCHYGRCCKGFWGSSGTFVFIELSQSQNSDISLNLLVFHSGKKENLY